MVSALLADPARLFYAAAGIVLLATLGVIVHVWPKAGVALFVASIAVSTDLRDPISVLATSVAGIQAGPLDVLAATMLVSAVVRIGSGQARGRHLVWIFLLVGVLGLNILRGVDAFGLQGAVNEARSWIYLFSAAAFCATAPIRDARWWTRLGILYCGWLTFRIVTGLAATGLQPVTSYIEVSGQLVDPRPITASAAVVLAQVMLLVTARTFHRREFVAVFVLAALLVVIQHRTVWFAAAGGLAYLALTKLRDGGRGRLAVVLGGGGLATVSVAALLTGLVQRSAVAVSASNLTASNNTFSWRLTGWRELLQDHVTPTAVLLGKPFGSGFRRLIGGQVVDVSAHSHYLETFLRFGLVGLFATGMAFVLAWRAASAVEPVTQGLRPTLVVVIFFGITYRCDPIQGILIGTILGVAAPQVRSVRPLPVGPRVALASA